MEQLLTEAKAIPLTKKFMLDKEEFSSLMRRLEESIPVDVQNAKTIIDQEENIISESNRIAEETTRNANAEAQSAVENAKQEANAMVADAQSRAAETLRTSTDQANAMVADAQTRANALVADAQARAAQMVADSEIVARAHREMPVLGSGNAGKRPPRLRSLHRPRARFHQSADGTAGYEHEPAGRGRPRAAPAVRWTAISKEKGFYF